MSPARWPLLAMLASSSLACGDGPPVVIPIDQIVRFVPDRLEFGMQPLGEDDATLMTRLESTGGDRLQIREVTFDPESDDFLARRTPNGALRGAYLTAGEPIDIVVAYQPGEPGPSITNMIVAFEGGDARLPLSATAYEVEPALAEASPTAILFQPAIELNRRVTQTISIKNIGEKPGAVRVVAARAPFSINELGGSPLNGAEIAPNESRSLEVAFTPTSEGMFEQTLQIALENSAPAEVFVSGEGVTAGSLSCTPGPIAFGDVERGLVRDVPIDCTVSGGVYTVQEIRIDNNDFAVISGAVAPGTRVTELHLVVRFVATGIAGTSRASLVIRSATNADTAMVLEGRVVAPLPEGTDLKVRLSWDTDDTDFDLHLSRNMASPFAPDDDCYFEHSHLDWGVPNDPDDDPFLDRDDQLGFGPEEINLGRASGYYDIYVQYFGVREGITNPPQTDVTIEYWQEGVQGMTLTRSMSTCGNMWHVGRLDFSGPTPQFNPIANEVDTWSGRAVRCP